MGAKFCFFTDPAKLKPQSSAGAFGPLAADQGKDRFRVTHRHEMVAAGAPAIAVCDGILCAQTESSGALTLVLKPSQVPPFEAPVVSYFLYKGIDPGSLLGGDDVLDESATAANDLTKRVAATWKDQNGGVLTGSKSGLGLDRDAAFLHDASDPSSKVFADGDPIERLFTYPHPKFQLPVVKAGDRIGSFGVACGFEIVLLRLGYRPKLGFARRADNVIAVPSLPASNGGAPWQPDDYDFFVHWHAKEQALAYMDPAAYFGAFIQAKLYKSDGDDTDRVKGKDVHDEILATFANRNVAWLDIRNNYGYSYNLFGLYGDTIRFASRSDPGDINDVSFRDGDWPLARLEIGDVPGARRGALHRTALRLPAGLAAAPAVLLSKGFASELGAERPRQKAPPVAVDQGNPAWLTPIRLAFPAVHDGGQDRLAASYTRVNLYEPRRGDPAPLGALGIGGSNYLDGIFRARELQLDKAFRSANMRLVVYPEETLVDLSMQGGPTYAAAVGVAEDAANTILFALPSHLLDHRLERAEQQPLPSWADRDSDDTDFLTWLTKSFKYTEVKKRTVTPAGGTGDVETLMVRHEPSIHHDPAQDMNRLEDYCLLVLPSLDHAQLLAEIDADADAATHLPGFLVVSSSQVKYDASRDLSYVEASLASLTIADAGAGKATLHTTPLSQKVYEYGDS